MPSLFHLPLIVSLRNGAHIKPNKCVRIVRENYGNGEWVDDYLHSLIGVVRADDVVVRIPRWIAAQHLKTTIVSCRVDIDIMDVGILDAAL